VEKLMPGTPLIAELRAANERLQTLLAQLQQDSAGAGVAGTDALVRLLSEVASTARLSGFFRGELKDSAAGAQELSRYRRILQELRRLLPAIHTRLLSDRARLETERSHCCAASAWAEANRRTF
jgi:hypothetical protein